MITTEEENKQFEYKITIATQTLERNINFITTCDQKTGIFLTAIGVFLTVVGGDGCSKAKKFFDLSWNRFECYDILFFAVGIFSVLSFFCGLINLVMVLNAKVSESAKGQIFKPSRIFFSGINKCIEYDGYKKKFLNMSQEELLNELIEQIYINSDIAVKKYRRFNTGIKFTLAGLLIFVLWFLVGVYYLEV